MCWSAPPPAPVRRWSGSSPSTWRCGAARRPGARRKCFYTTPIKALSNQKYHDLVARYGAEQVGLLTGDNAINGDAPVVVMTTEVLRNMLYAGSSTLQGLAYVVMDEVHYLADRFRGGVWEEVIIHLPASVTLVSLSATVSNAEEFADWLVTVRGETAVVVSEHRPVPLWQHMLVGKRMFDLFHDADAARKHDVHPELLRYTRETCGGWSWARGAARAPVRADVARAGVARCAPTSSTDWTGRVCSRRSCSSSAGPVAPPPCSSAWPPGCGSPRRRSGPRSAGSSSPGSPPFPGRTCRFWATGSGWTVWNAAWPPTTPGMLPVFKEVVEELFVRGLVKAVFATETLALGINMPARCVVLERLVKYNGEAHVDLTPGEYTQLTGRAGRRGIDVEGHAVVVWSPETDPRHVAGLASTRTYPLRSSFRPSYNMAVNLVGTVGAEPARALLESSFAQFQADRSVVGLARQVQRNTETIEAYGAEAACHHGDFDEYFALRVAIAEREKAIARQGQTPAQGRRGGLVGAAAGRRRDPGAVGPAGRAGRGAGPGDRRVR